MWKVKSGGYGTVDGGTSSAPPSPTPATPRPWREFLDVWALSRPNSYEEGMMRVRRNMRYFEFNYAAVTLLMVFLSLLWHPISIIVFLILLISWHFFYFSRQGPLVILNRTIDDSILLCVLALLSVVSLVSTHVGLNVLLSLILAALLLSLHAAFRVTQDLFLHEQSRLLSVVGTLPPTTNYTPI
ncbi:hypothetical protein VNO78_34731 [Psophocarpus tetragonolobus]|uniref:PRA1 family protein n=1 Tax=Psophocarpus tetragonolobus TaxID=3891 RepID=A0AAN9NUW9_PSOTE